MAVKENKNAREINIRKVQQALLEAGAYLMPLIDVGPEDKDFQSIQRVATSGILKVKGESWKWANRTWFYPDTTITVKEFSEGLNAFDNKIILNNDQSVLTLQEASTLLSALLNRETIDEIKQLWNSRMNRKFDPKLAVSKRELSVLADELIHPFETKAIGFDGNYL